MPEIAIREADLADPKDKEAFVTLLEAYMTDPKGDASGQSAIDPDVAGKLCAYPQAVVFFAEQRAAAVGMAVCFKGFSTFRAKELINLHDLVVLPKCRRQGIGQALVSAVEAYARTRGCCKITLEVREDNPAAQELYRGAGFGDEPVPMLFWVKYL